jgi:hypothetical protein
MDSEVTELTGKTRASAQIKVLRFMAIDHKRRPDGSVTVLRAHVDTIDGKLLA